MERLSPEAIASAVEHAGLDRLAPGVPERFSAYCDLLLRWNSKLNLTAIRSPEDILRRHFLECIFCAQSLPAGIATLLDYGSGAGFPGVPIALCRPEILVTLAESQGRKASFLREVVRVLGLDSEVHQGRVEAMPSGRIFDAVALRAVDKMGMALESATMRVSEDGWLVILAGSGILGMPPGFLVAKTPLPGSNCLVLVLARRDVPRGTL